MSGFFFFFFFFFYFLVTVLTHKNSFSGVNSIAVTQILKNKITFDQCVVLILCVSF